MQLLQAGAALGLGMCAGILYDFLRALRLLTRVKAVEWLCDALFCLCCAGGLFALGFSLGEGRQRVFLAVFALLGALLYRLTLSRAVRVLLRGAVQGAARCAHVLVRPAEKAGEQAEKMKKNSRNIFQYFNKWVILYHKDKNCMPVHKKRRTSPRRSGKRGTAFEVQKGRYLY